MNRGPSAEFSRGWVVLEVSTFRSGSVAVALATLLIGTAFGSEMELQALISTRDFYKQQGLIFGALILVFIGGGIYSALTVDEHCAVTHTYDTALAAGVATCLIAAMLGRPLGAYQSSFDSFKRRRSSLVLPNQF